MNPALTTGAAVLTLDDIKATRKVDDVAFLVALVDEIARKVSIDRARVFAAVFEIGGSFLFDAIHTLDRPSLAEKLATYVSSDSPKPRSHATRH